MFTKYPAGTLQVTIIEARKLHDEDLIGQNDAFVELWLDDNYKQRTTVIDNNNNPVWNQTFTFPLSESRKKTLHIHVLDKDLIGSDKIGEAKFDLEEAFSGRVVDTWVKLPAKLGLTNHGEVHIYIQFVPQ